ncbi:hypothetical protein H0A36_24450 [Endozoicomonas sp. SM1973]|uniref:Uncharacterized protein n=1 Tax=Spartinivicinus marinus TaxID=2994442 RepID=A0A853IJB7_9GAMM|nr:hypothetical protein [Spartinivicinus marinus]MCX4029618.1 hypothetical protein [Spartinivicinus marinus]NYZ69175.1 hypothetical protein [Spartinivicinus marinus]
MQDSNKKLEQRTVGLELTFYDETKTNWRQNYDKLDQDVKNDITKNNPEVTNTLSKNIYYWDMICTAFTQETGTLPQPNKNRKGIANIAKDIYNDENAPQNIRTRYEWLDDEFAYELTTDGDVLEVVTDPFHSGRLAEQDKIREIFQITDGLDLYGDAKHGGGQINIGVLNPEQSISEARTLLAQILMANTYAKDPNNDYTITPDVIHNASPLESQENANLLQDTKTNDDKNNVNAFLKLLSQAINLTNLQTVISQEQTLQDKDELKSKIMNLAKAMTQNPSSIDYAKISKKPEEHWALEYILHYQEINFEHILPYEYTDQHDGKAKLKQRSNTAKYFEFRSMRAQEDRNHLLDQFTFIKAYLE